MASECFLALTGLNTSAVVSVVGTDRCETPRLHDRHETSLQLHGRPSLRSDADAGRLPWLLLGHPLPLLLLLLLLPLLLLLSPRGARRLVGVRGGDGDGRYRPTESSWLHRLAVSAIGATRSSWSPRLLLRLVC